MTKICCICQKVEADSVWCGDVKIPENARITHGYCPHCFDDVMATIMDYIDKKQYVEPVCQVDPALGVSSAACA